MSALLSTTVGGTRKKISGATSYKRPGPPTPSKNGGRLSFGGNSEPAREILKESHEGNAAAVTSSSKTPARFKIFASRFSMGNTIKDEPVCLDLRKAVQKKNFQLIRMVGAGAVCTSTPRKSKSHFDQRRLLDQMLKSSPSPSPSSPSAVLVIETPKTFGVAKITNTPNPDALLIESIEQQKQDGCCMRSRRTSLLRQSRSNRTAVTVVDDAIIGDGGVCASSNAIFNVHCSTSASTSSDCRSVTLQQRYMRRRPKRVRGTRPSLYLCNNIFAKNRTPTRDGAIYRDLFRTKARRQRMENFNKYRMMKTMVKQEVLESDEMGEEDRQNNNYAHINHNQLGETVVLMKGATPLQLINRDVVDVDVEDDTANINSIQCSSVYAEDDSEDDDELIESHYHITDEEDEVDFGESEANIASITEIIGDNPQLVTSMELLEFDKKQCMLQQLQDEGDQSMASVNSKYFEQLLKETESEAPFEVKQLQYESTATTAVSSLTTSVSVSNIHVASQNTASSSAAAYNSRTIYGGSVIFNRKIPNVNTTFVRKSSIYIKRKDADEDDIILVTNQTITLLDLFRMWRQMNSTARLMLGIVILVSFTAFLSLFVNFFMESSAPNSNGW